MGLPIGATLFASVLLSANALGRTPMGVPAEARDNRVLAADAFLKEYAMGVHRIPMDGGKIYGWKLNDRVTFGRFKGENDEFGFSVEMNPRDRVEVTKDGMRWRRAIGGHH